MKNTVRAPSPVYQVLHEVNWAAQQGFGVLALLGASALPDLCVSLASSDGSSDYPRFEAWCVDNLAAVLPHLSPQEIYLMRSGLLSNGSASPRSEGRKRALFVFPTFGEVFQERETDEVRWHNGREFVMAISHAVANWYERHRDDSIVVENTHRMLQYRPELAMYAGGGRVVF